MPADAAPAARRRWPLPAYLAVAFVLLGCGAGLLALSAVRAEKHLRAVRAHLTVLRADLLNRAVPPATISADLAAVRRPAEQAATDLGGPAWGALSHLPVLGRAVTVVRGVAAAADTLATRVLPDLAAVEHDLRGQSLHTATGGISLVPFEQATFPLGRAELVAVTIRADVSRLPARSGVAAVDQARRTLLSQLDSLVRQLDPADAAVRLLPPMLGAAGSRHYLVVFENDAEARGLGGLPGAYAVLTATGGALHVDRFGADTDFAGVTARVDLGADYAARYGTDPQALFVNADESPHFPYAARLWLAMYAARFHTALDGVLAVDPTALAGLLAVTGPATLPDGQALGADAVVPYTESAVYARYPELTARKAAQVAAAAAIAHQLLSHGPQHDTALGSALAAAVGQRRVLLYSARPAEQDLLATQPIAGLLPAAAGPYAYVVVNNAAGSKLDYYLQRDLRYAGAGCGSHGVRATTVTATLTNAAPASGLPAYVTARADLTTGSRPPGTNRELVSLYATPGAQLTGVTVDGAPGTAQVDTELTHPVFTADVELAPGQTRSVVFRLAEPVVPGPALVPVQPLVQPATVRTEVAVC